jgi:uncharacterized protein
MEFEWNEDKNLLNIQKHGFHFREAVFVLEGDHIRKLSPRGTEERWIAIGKIRDEIAAVVYTIRDNRYRIISIRRGRNEEKRAYGALYQ